MSTTETPRVLPETPGLEIDEQLISIHAINPFITSGSSSRANMLSSHLSQMLTLNNGDEKIIQTGMEKQLGANTFSKKLENDSRIINVIKLYGGIDSNSVNTTTELLIIFEDLVTGMIDYIDLPRYFSMHQYFGFEYKWNEDALGSLIKDNILPAGTIFADSPAVTSNSGYKFGVNADVALVTIPEVAEDGMVISEDFAKRLEYTTYETRSIEFGVDSFPLNLYGDKDHYKPFPEVGEKVNDDSVFIVLRKYDNELAPALNSVYDVMEFDPVYDEAVYVKPDSYVENIKIYNNKKFKKNIWNGTSEMTVKYAEGLKKYYSDIIDTYEDLERDHYKRYRNNNMRVSEQLNKLLLDAYAMVNPDNNKIEYTYKNEKMDLVRIEVTLKHVTTPVLGGKITNMIGGKGVIVEIRKKEEMAMDKYGNYADVMADPTSISSRMNISVLYEQYFNAASRKTKHMVTEKIFSYDNSMDAVAIIEILTPKETLEVFDIVLGLLKIIDTEQYTSYANLVATDNYFSIKDILVEIVTKEMFIYYTVKAKKRAYQVVEDLKRSPYAADIDYITFLKDGKRVRSNNKMIMAPLYMILLFKTGDEYLSVASAKTNHYNFPIGVSKINKNRIPWRASPVKVLSETESRLFTAYGSRLGIAEMKDRANSITTHKMVYKSILEADKPTVIARAVDRTKQPYGTDASLQLVNNIFNCAGIELEYKPDN